MGSKPSYLYMFVNAVADSSQHRSLVETPRSKIYTVGVSNFEEGAAVAERMVKEEGVALIELCGGFGYEGAKIVHARVGDKIPVGLVVHQVWNAPAISTLFESLKSKS